MTFSIQATISGMKNVVDECWNFDPQELAISGTDPGFLRGGGAYPRGGDGLTYNFVKCSQKLHEIEKKLDPGGGGGMSLAPPLDPPMHIYIYRIDTLLEGAEC